MADVGEANVRYPGRGQRVLVIGQWAAGTLGSKSTCRSQIEPFKIQMYVKNR